MKNYLIDTHMFLWFNEGSNRLTEKSRKIICDKENDIYLSIASLWEISIKTALNKLKIKGTYAGVMDDVIHNQFTILPITFAHTVQQNGLDFIHRDPFDRIIISQALVENMDLISADTNLDKYFSNSKEKRVWK